MFVNKVNNMLIKNLYLISILYANLITLLCNLYNYILYTIKINTSFIDSHLNNITKKIIKIQDTLIL